MSDIVIDASVLIALLKEERGYEAALPYFTDNVLISSVNWAEVVGYVATKNSALITDLPTIFSTFNISILPFTISDAYTVGELLTKTKPYGLSLGDRACIALAMEKKAAILTADRAWKKLNLGVKIQCIR